MGLCFFMATSGTVGFMGNGSIRKSILEIIDDRADSEARVVLMLSGNGNVTEINEYRFSASVPTAMTVLLAALSTLWTFWAMFCWSSGYCVLIVVGFAMSLLLVSLREKIVRKSANVMEVRWLLIHLKLIGATR